MVTKKNFENTIKQFHEKEDMRDKLWDMALNLIKKGFEIEAHILILATWNFARFRFDMINFDLDKYKNKINLLAKHFKNLKNTKFESFDFDNPNNKNQCDDIIYIFKSLKNQIGQTGASKIMALINQNLFIMWDTKIRQEYRKKYKKNKIGNGETPENYINFLKAMKKEFKGVDWKNKGTPFAKAIDEYNYVLTQSKK